MNLTYVKYGLVGIALIGGFVLVGIGKLDAGAMFDKSTGMIGALVVALGISAAGQQIGQGNK